MLVGAIEKMWEERRSPSTIRAGAAGSLGSLSDHSRGLLAAEIRLVNHKAMTRVVVQTGDSRPQFCRDNSFASFILAQVDVGKAGFVG